MCALASNQSPNISFTEAGCVPQTEDPVQLSFWPAQLLGARECLPYQLPSVSEPSKVISAAPGKRRGKSMSRRTGQNGYIERSGKWWVVRWWMDVPDQYDRRHLRAKICPVSGVGYLKASERKKRARDIIAASGADSSEFFNKVVKQEESVTFQKQAMHWLEQMKTRKRKPVATSTLELWDGCLRIWLNPKIGNLPLSEINNAVLKSVVATMSEGGLSPKTIENYTQVVKMVVASAVDKEGEEIYPRKWNHEFVDMPVVEKASRTHPASPLRSCRAWQPGRRNGSGWCSFCVVLQA